MFIIFRNSQGSHSIYLDCDGNKKQLNEIQTANAQQEYNELTEQDKEGLVTILQETRTARRLAVRNVNKAAVRDTVATSDKVFDEVSSVKTRAHTRKRLLN